MTRAWEKGAQVTPLPNLLQEVRLEAADHGIKHAHQHVLWHEQSVRSI